jgi:hypothetical protein
MIWTLLYIPVALYLGYAFTSHLEPVSWAIVSAVIVGFCLVEGLMVRKDRDRSRVTFAVLCLTLASLLGGLILRG